MGRINLLTRFVKDNAKCMTRSEENYSRTWVALGVGIRMGRKDFGIFDEDYRKAGVFRGRLTTVETARPPTGFPEIAPSPNEKTSDHVQTVSSQQED